MWPQVGEVVGEVQPLDRILESIGPGWRDHLRDFEAVEADLTERGKHTALDFPTYFRVEEIGLKLLYAVTRERRPSVILETGVANGYSTVTLLAALARNGSGALHSTDVVETPAPLLTSAERASWHYHRIGQNKPRKQFADLVASLGPIDLFFHDSDHTYAWQRFEYETIAGKLSPDAVLISDDVDASYAFLDFCAGIGRQPRFILDTRKVVGLLLPGA
jgi:predicted O-methyltransferase YrrM